MPATCLHCRLAFAVATDAPLSQEKIAASLLCVEGQVQSLAASNAALRQELADKIGKEVLPHSDGGDSAKAEEILEAKIYLNNCLSCRPIVHLVNLSLVHNYGL